MAAALSGIVAELKRWRCSSRRTAEQRGRGDEAFQGGEQFGYRPVKFRGVRFELRYLSGTRAFFELPGRCVRGGRVKHADDPLDRVRGTLDTARIVFLQRRGNLRE